MAVLVSNMKVEVRPVYSMMYMELKSTPFYKADDGYCYASYLLEDESKETELLAFLKREESFDMTKKEHAKAKSYFKTALERLSKLTISDNALSAWLTFQKEQDGVKEYHQILEELRDQIELLCFENVALVKTEQEPNIDTKKELSNEAWEPILINEYFEENLSCPNRKAVWDTVKTEKDNSLNVVLNRNNPFADISIQEQTFTYGSVMGQFETLELSTSKSLTKVAKNTEQSYLVLQPGFKIKKVHGQKKANHQKVIFDDTLTTELVENDDNVYVFIDE